MAQQHINYGTSPNDGTGDTLRVSQIKAESNFNELYANKVDKVDGKELSDNNFSDADKAKLDSLDPDAGAQSDWNEGDVDSPAFIIGKPENTSDFFNDGDGIAPFIEDVQEVGAFARSAGEWVSIPMSANTTDDITNNSNVAGETTTDALNTIDLYGLQKPYSNNPLITTSVEKGPLKVKRGSSSDTDNILVGQNGVEATTFAVTGNGTIKMSIPAGSTAPVIDITGGTNPYIALSSGSVQTFIQALNTGGTGVIGTVSNHPFDFAVNNSTKLKIFTDGNTVFQNGGTFTNNGIDRLQVSGSVLSTGFKVTGTTGYLKSDGTVDSATGVQNEFSPTKTVTSDGLYNAFPSIIKLSNGNLMMVYRKGTEHTVTGNGYIVSRTSINNGYSWGSEVVVMQDAIADTDYRDPSLTQLQNGNLILSYFLHTGTDVFNNYQAYTSVSTNLGSTWNTPVPLSGYATWNAVSAPVIQLTNGDLLISTYGRDGANYKTQIHKSVNSGASWGLLSILTSQVFTVESAPYYTEPVLIKLANEDVLATIRNEVTSQTAIAKSTNSGVSWSTVTDKFSSNSRANMNITFNNRIIFSYRSVLSSDSSSYPTLNYSDDSGATFGANPNYIILPREDILDEYSSLANLGNGTFAYVYSVETSSSTANIYHKYVTGGFSVAPVEGLNANGLINRSTSRLFGKSYFYDKSYFKDDTQLIEDKALLFGSTLGSGGEFGIKYDVDKLSIFRSGNEITLLNNGNFGLNTPNPLNKLDVYGNPSDTSLLFNSSAIANFRGADNTQLSINSELSAPYAMAIQVKNAVAGSTAYPLKLNPLGGPVYIGDLEGLGDSAIGVDEEGKVKRIASSTPYLKYVALLSQSGTSAPVATVLENTLGGTVVWGRTSVGQYTATLAGAFTASKTAVFTSGGADSGNIIKGGSRSNTNDVGITVYVPGSGLVDGLMSNVSFEIRVYP